MLASPEFWVAVSIVLFFLLFGKMLFGAIFGALDSRAEKIRSELAEAAIEMGITFYWFPASGGYEEGGPEKWREWAQR